MKNIPVEVSARHVHLDAANWRKLFGEGAPTVGREISQPPQFIAKERITLSGPSGSLERIGIVGPLREYTQAELSMTDARRLGIQPPLRDSGNLDGAADVTLTGPVGSITIPAAIIQHRHIHASPADAQELGVTDREMVSVRLDSSRGGVLEHVLIRVDESFELRLHLDTDEGNALGVTPDFYATIVR